MNNDRGPILAFMEDLHEAITGLNDDGDLLLLGVDWNEDVRAPETTAFFQKLGMREVLLERHGDDAPKTYADRSYPIDGIFASYSLDIEVGGYLAFGNIAETDHRGLWVDICKGSFCGSWTTIARAPARRIITGNPRVEKK